MLKRTEVRALALVLGAATVVACSDTATAPDAQTSASDVLFAKGGNGGGGGGKPGGGGGGGGATTMDMGTLSDDGGLYVDGTDRTIVTLTDGLSVRTFSGNAKQESRASTVRKLCFNLPAPNAVHSTGDLDAFTTMAGGDLSDFCSRVAMHTRNEDIPLNSLGDGLTTIAGGKIVLQDLSAVRGDWEWRLIFDTSSQGVGGGDAIGEGLCVTRNGTKWTFENGCAAVDDDVELWRVVDGGFTLVAEFSMPFEFTVTPG